MSDSPKMRASTAAPSRRAVAAPHHATAADAPAPGEMIVSSQREEPLAPPPVTAVPASADPGQQQQQQRHRAENAPAVLSLAQMRRVQQLFELYDWVRRFQREPAADARVRPTNHPSDKPRHTCAPKNDTDDDEIVLWEPKSHAESHLHRNAAMNSRKPVGPSPEPPRKLSSEAAVTLTAADGGGAVARGKRLLMNAMNRRRISARKGRAAGDGQAEGDDDEGLPGEALLPPLAKKKPRWGGGSGSAALEGAGSSGTVAGAARVVCSRHSLWRELFNRVDKDDEAITARVTLQSPADAAPTERTYPFSTGTLGLADTNVTASTAAAMQAEVARARHAACRDIIAREQRAMMAWKVAQLERKQELQDAEVALPGVAAAATPGTAEGNVRGTGRRGADGAAAATASAHDQLVPLSESTDTAAALVVPSSAGIPFPYFASAVLSECYPFFFPSWEPAATASLAGDAPQPKSSRPASSAAAAARIRSQEKGRNTEEGDANVNANPAVEETEPARAEPAASSASPAAQFGEVFSPLWPERVAAARELFHVMDTNADGLVRWDDFAAHVLLHSQQRAQHTGGHDDGDDGEAAVAAGGGDGRGSPAAGESSLEYTLQFSQAPVNRSPWQASFPLVHHLYHKEPVTHLVVCEATKKYVTAASDGLVKLWKTDPRLPDARGKASIVHERNLLSTRSCVMGLALAPPSLGDAEVVAVVAMDGTLTLMRTASGETVRSLLGVKASTAAASAADSPHRGTRLTSTAEAVAAVLSSGGAGTSPLRRQLQQQQQQQGASTGDDTASTRGGAAVLRMPFTIGAYRSDAIEIFFGRTNQYFHGLTVVPPPFEHLKRPVVTTSDLLLDFGVGEEVPGVPADASLPFSAVGRTAAEEAARGVRPCWFATSVALAYIVPASAQSPLVPHHRRHQARLQALAGPTADPLASSGEMKARRPDGAASAGISHDVISPYLMRAAAAGDIPTSSLPADAGQQQPQPQSGTDAELLFESNGGAYAILGFENGLLQLYELRKAWFSVNQLSATRVEAPAARVPVLTTRLHAAAITRILITERSDMLMTASDDGTVCVRQLSRLEVPLMRLGDGAVPSLSACLDAAHRYLSASPSLSSYQHTVQQQAMAHHVHGHAKRIVCTAWNEETHTLVTGGRDFMLYFWSPRSHRPLRKVDLRTLRTIHGGRGTGSGDGNDGGRGDDGGGAAESSFGASGYPIDMSFIGTAEGSLSALYASRAEAAAAMASCTAGKARGGMVATANTASLPTSSGPSRAGRGAAAGSTLRLLILDNKRVLRILNVLTGELLCVLADDAASSLVLGDMLVARFDTQTSRLILGGTCLRVWDVQGDDSSYPPSYTGHRRPVLFLQWSYALKAYVTADEDHICVWHLGFAENAVALEQRRWRRAARELYAEKQEEKAQRMVAEAAVRAFTARRLANVDIEKRDGGEADSSETNASRAFESSSDAHEEPSRDSDSLFSGRGSIKARSGVVLPTEEEVFGSLPPPPLDFNDRFPTIDDVNPHNQCDIQCSTRLLRSWRVAAGVRAVAMTTLPTAATSDTTTHTGDRGTTLSVVSRATVTVSVNIEGLFVALLREAAVVQYNLFNGAPLRRFTFPDGSQELSSLSVSLLPSSGFLAKSVGHGDKHASRAPASANDVRGEPQQHQPMLCAAFEASLTSGIVSVYPIHNGSDADAVAAAAQEATNGHSQQRHGKRLPCRHASGGDAAAVCVGESRFALPPTEEDVIQATLVAARASKSSRVRTGLDINHDLRAGAAGTATAGGPSSSSASSLVPRVAAHRKLLFRQSPVASAAFLPLLGLVVVGGLGSLHFSPANDVTTRAFVCLSLEEQEDMRRRNEAGRGNETGNSSSGSPGTGRPTHEPTRALANTHSAAPLCPRRRWVALSPGRLVPLPPLTEAEEAEQMERIVQLTPGPPAPPPPKNQQPLPDTTPQGGEDPTQESGRSESPEAESVRFFAAAQASSLGFLGHLCPVPDTPYLFSGSNVGTIQLWGLRTSCELARFDATLTMDTVTCLEVFVRGGATEGLTGSGAGARDASRASFASSMDCYVAVGNQSGFVALFDMSEIALHGPGLLEGRATGSRAADVPSPPPLPNGQAADGPDKENAGPQTASTPSQAAAPRAAAASYGFGLEEKMVLLDRWRAHWQDVRSISFIRVETTHEVGPGSDGAKHAPVAGGSAPPRFSASATFESDRQTTAQQQRRSVVEMQTITLATAGEDSFIYVWRWANAVRGGLSAGGILHCLGCFGGGSSSAALSPSGPPVSAARTITDPPLYDVPLRTLKTHDAARHVYVLRRLIVDHRLFLATSRSVTGQRKSKDDTGPLQRHLSAGMPKTSPGGQSKLSAAAIALEVEMNERRLQRIFHQQLEAAVHVMEEDAQQLMRRDPAWGLSLVGSLGLRSREETDRLQKQRRLRREKIKSLLSIVDRKAAEDKAEQQQRRRGRAGMAKVAAASISDDPVALYDNVEGQPFSAIFARPAAPPSASAAPAGPLSLFDRGGLAGAQYWENVCGFDPAEAAAAANCGESQRQSSSPAPNQTDVTTGADKRTAARTAAHTGNREGTAGNGARVRGEPSPDRESPWRRELPSAAGPEAFFDDVGLFNEEGDAASGDVAVGVAAGGSRRQHQEEEEPRWSLGRAPWGQSTASSEMAVSARPSLSLAAAHSQPLVDVLPASSVAYVSPFHDGDAGAALSTAAFGGHHQSSPASIFLSRTSRQQQPLPLAHGAAGAGADAGQRDATSSVACLPYVFAFMKGSYSDASVRECVARIVQELRPWIRKFRKALQQQERLVALERQRQEAAMLRPSTEKYFEFSINSDLGPAAAHRMAAERERKKRATLTVGPPTSPEEREAAARRASASGSHSEENDTHTRGGTAFSSTATASDDFLEKKRGPSSLPLAATARCLPNVTDLASTHVVDDGAVTAVAPLMRWREWHDSRQATSRTEDDEGCLSGSQTQNPLPASAVNQEEDSSRFGHTLADAADTARPARAPLQPDSSNGDEHDGDADSDPEAPAALSNNSDEQTRQPQSQGQPALDTAARLFAEGRTSFRVAFGNKAGAHAAPVVLRATPDTPAGLAGGQSRSPTESRSQTPSSSTPSRHTSPVPATPLGPPAAPSPERPPSTPGQSPPLPPTAANAAAKALQLIAAPYRRQVTAAATATGAGKQRGALGRGATAASQRSNDAGPCREDGGEERDDEDGELRPPPEHEIDDIALDGEDAARVVQVAYMHRRRVEALGRLLELQQSAMRDRILNEKNHGRGNHQLALEAGLVGLADYHDFAATDTVSVFFGTEKTLLKESAAAVAIRKRRNVAGSNLVRDLTRANKCDGAARVQEGDEKRQSAADDLGAGTEVDGDDWYTARDRMKRARKEADALWNPSRVMLTLMDWDSPALHPEQRDAPTHQPRDADDPLGVLALQSASPSDPSGLPVEGKGMLTLPALLPPLLAPFHGAAPPLPDAAASMGRHPVGMAQAYQVLYGREHDGNGAAGEEGGPGGPAAAASLSATVAREMAAMKERRRELLQEKETLSAHLALTTAATAAEDADPLEPGDSFAASSLASASAESVLPSSAALADGAATGRRGDSTASGWGASAPTAPPAVRTQRLFERRKRNHPHGAQLPGEEAPVHIAAPFATPR